MHVNKPRAEATPAAATTRSVGARLAVAAVVVWLWLWLRVDPGRIYHASGLTALPAWSPDPMYLRSYVAAVGGPLKWVCAWLSQLLVWPALGAAVLTASAVAAAHAADRAAASLAGRRLAGLRYVPLLLFVMLDGAYVFLLDWQVGWAVALAVAAAVLRWPEPRPVVRLAVLGLGTLLLYYLLAGPALVAVALVAIGESRRRETWGVAALLALLAAAAPWLFCRFCFDQPLVTAYRAVLPPVVSNDRYGLALAAGAAMLAFAVLVGALAMRAATSGPPRPARPLLSWAGLAAVCALLPVIGHDRAEAQHLELSRRAALRDWSGLLDVAKGFAAEDLTQFDGYLTLLALAHTGRVGDDLFGLSVPPFAALRDHPRLGEPIEVLRMRAQFGVQLRDLALELGLVNEAEHETHETLETQGANPRLLVSMARIQAMQGRPEAARVFLRLAAAQPGDPAGAARLMRELAANPTLAGDPVQRELAAHRLTTDIPDVYRLMPLLEQATREHPEHRLAQEYLMALYLLDNRIDRLVAALPNLPRFGRAELPRHYEEAALCWEVLAGRPADLGPWTIRPEARQRFEAFARALECDTEHLAAVLRVPGRPPGIAGQVWHGPWSDTYYYYRLFGTSGVPQ